LLKIIIVYKKKFAKNYKYIKKKYFALHYVSVYVQYCLYPDQSGSDLCGRHTLQGPGNICSNTTRSTTPMYFNLLF